MESSLRSSKIERVLVTVIPLMSCNEMTKSIFFNLQLIEVINDIMVTLKSYSGPVDSGRNARLLLQQFDPYSNDIIKPRLAEANAALEQMPNDAEIDQLTYDRREIVVQVADELQRMNVVASNATDSTAYRLSSIVACHDFLDQVIYKIKY